MKWADARYQSLFRRAKLMARLDAPGDVLDGTKYWKHQPWAKQKTLLACEGVEAFYGGAAGGGKSDALLMAALQYVHVPRYSALILRRDFARLNLPGAIMDRAKEWLMNTDAKWNEQRKTFSFPSGATLQFGYLDNPNDRYRYASSEFQFIGWDELTEFELSDDERNPYLFLFSRLRKTRDLAVPLRVRSASNPGNIGHAWVRGRFIDEATTNDGGDTFVRDDRVFVPARIHDNPALDEEEYRAKLDYLPPIARARLMQGDWDVVEGTIIDPTWLQRYEESGGTIWLLDTLGNRLEGIDSRQCRRFVTCDTAGTSKDKADEQRGKPASWSVVAVWDFHQPRKTLFLRSLWRGRVAFGELRARGKATHDEWRPQRFYLENAHVGPALASELKPLGVPAETIGPTIPGMADGHQGAKLDRAIASGLLSMMERGHVRIPKVAPWVRDYERELTTWTGKPEEVCDQIDVTSYAAYLTKREGSAWGGVL